MSFSRFVQAARRYFCGAQRETARTGAKPGAKTA